MSVRNYSRKNFLDEFSFPREFARDFELDGQPAEFASGHPKQWGSWCEIIDYGKEGEVEGDGVYKRSDCALSSDRKLLAICPKHERILVYDLATKELRAKLEGAGPIVFKPAQGPERPGYTLISSILDTTVRGADSVNKLILWDLDQHGRVIVEEEPIDVVGFATKAINAILPELTAEHEWTRDFAQASSLQTSFEVALRQAAADHRRRHHTVLTDARLGSCGSSTFGTDGKLLLYHTMNQTTQHGMRGPEKLPHVVVYDVDMGKEVHRLSGHTDTIMWSAIGPDNQRIASVSWDGTLRMYDALSGDLIWATDDSGGQSWAGAFTPDSRHIIWSSNRGKILQVHQVHNGEKVAAFQEELSDWCRHIVWHPDAQQVAFCVGKEAYVWRPFDGPNGSVVQHFVLDENKNWHRMASILDVEWLEEGRLLCLQFSDGTKLVYDTQNNSKEVFARPKGVDAAWVGSGFHGILRDEEEHDHYISVDGDGKVRLWRTSVPAFPSWWEKGESEKKIAASPKKMYPETGKYVKVTKVASKDTASKDDGRNSWAEKGAELWTAE